MYRPSLYPLIPGQKLEGDWYNGSIPSNIVVGQGSLISSSICFKEYRARGNAGLIVGEQVTIWGASLCPESEGVIEIGDYSFIASAILASLGCPASSAFTRSSGMSVSSSKYIRITASGICMNFFIISYGGSLMPM